MLISEDYRQLNQQLHAEDKNYGISGSKYADVVRKVCGDFFITHVLDYGCGKGRLKEALGEGFQISEYDPAIESLNVKPLPADLVYCGDVLEHIEPDSLNFVLSDIRRCMKKMAILVTNSEPSMKKLPDGRNAHLIQKPLHWWFEVISDKFHILNYINNKHDHIFMVRHKDEGRRRWDWILDMSRQHGYSVGVELGVHTGRTSLYLASRGLSMYAVDTWIERPDLKDVPGGQTYEGWQMEKVFQTFKANVSKYKLPINILRMDTVEASKKIMDKSVDFVFVDASHTYEDCKRDIEAWLPKIKEGGMMAGHDYNWPTVRRAVHEFFPDVVLGHDNCWGVFV